MGCLSIPYMDGCVLREFRFKSKVNSPKLIKSLSISKRPSFSPNYWWGSSLPYLYLEQV